MKRILMIVLLVSSFFMFSLKTNAATNKASDNVLDYKVDTYFRGVWVTPKDGGNIGNIKPTSGKTKEQKIADYKLEVTRILDIMEWYNLNALIFHIRVDNDAIYYSDLNPWSAWFTTYDKDPGWDPLEWVIEETHKRGIEFHAWMNPYRVKANGVKKGVTLEEFAKTIPSYNIASKPEMLLLNTYDANSNGVILNPGLPEVRKFIIDTCMEVIEKYDVDAIHFDDYFYATGVEDSKTYAKYNPNNLKLADWRRNQVDTFIKDLSATMRKYNQENNRHVQLGISPSGVWLSGNGKVTYDENGTAITNGSLTTTSFQHYGDYLYSDTKKWVDEEWIDYILPQTYWGISHPSAGFKPLMDWWDAIVKYKKVNLYSGMGIYMSATPGTNYSWGTDPDESVKQIQYCYDLENTLGTVFYNFTYLKDAYYGKTDSLYGKGTMKIHNELFVNPAVLPEVRTMERVLLPAPTNFNVENGEKNVVSFDAVENAKFYVIYRSEKEVDFSAGQVYKIISRDSVDGKVTFIDKNSNGKMYSYGVKALSGTNTLGEGASEDSYYKVTFKDYDGTILKEQIVGYGKSASAPTPKGKENATFVGWSRDITNITSDIVIEAKYSDSDFIVKFYGIDAELLKTQTVKYRGNAIAPEVDNESYEILGWSDEFTNVSKDLDIYLKYKIKEFKVVFKENNPDDPSIDNVLFEEVVKYGENAIAPKHTEYKGYNFVGWSEDISCVKSDLIVKAVYEPIYYTVTFVNSEDDSVIDVQKVRFGEDAKYPEPPQVKGMVFEYWRGTITHITGNRTIQAIYGLAEYEVIFKDYDGTILKTLYVIYEEEVEAPDCPKREGYTFVGWDKDFSEVLSDLVINAVYHKDFITIKYFDSNKKLLDESEVENKDQEIVANYDPPYLEGYVFVKWDKEVDESGNVNFFATYREVSTSQPGTENCTFMTIKSAFTLISALGIAFLIRKRKMF